MRNLLAWLLLAGVAGMAQPGERFQINREKSMGNAETPVCQALLRHLNTKCSSADCELDFNGVSPLMAPAIWVQLPKDKAISAALAIARAEAARLQHVIGEDFEANVRSAVEDDRIRLFHHELTRPWQLHSYGASDKLCETRDLVMQVQMTGMLPNRGVQVYSMSRSLTALNQCPSIDSANFSNLVPRWDASFTWDGVLFAVHGGEELVPSGLPAMQTPLPHSQEKVQYVVARAFSEGTECHYEAGPPGLKSSANKSPRPHRTRTASKRRVAAILGNTAQKKSPGD